MKKRILALVCAATMVMGMSLTVCAQGSGTAGKTAQNAVAQQSTEIVSIENNTGQTLSAATIASFAETTGIAAGVQGATIEAVPTNTAKAMIAEANNQVGANTFIAAVVDLKVPAGTGTATFTLTCPNVWAGQKVTILHLKSDGTYEMITPSNVANNSVTFTMTSYSPIAIVIDTAASPKTGDDGLAAGAMIALMAMAAAMAGAVAYRKVRA